jgi:hypothetical protein
MRTPSVTVFCKQANCPSAETLLSYHVLETAFEQAQWITEHLESCEFCAAEFRLLAEHEAVEEEEYPLTEIPAHLRSLAEALLGKIELSGLVSLSEASYEKERLTLTDA